MTLFTKCNVIKLLEVHFQMKLIDTENGKVLGRVRNFVNAHIASEGFGPAEDLFDNGADNFRKLFSGLTKKKVTNNLVDLRLLPK